MIVNESFHSYRKRPVDNAEGGLATRPADPSAALLAASAPAAADSASEAGDITVERPWASATPGGATVAVGCLTLRNAGAAPDRLVSATTAVAEPTGPRGMAMADGAMRMRPLPGGIAVPAHGTAVHSPNGDHRVLEGPKHPLRAGERFAGTPVFGRAGPIPVTVSVESVGAPGTRTLGGFPRWGKQGR